MSWIVLVPIVFQNAAMFFDEFHYHRRRGLPRWERIGHPLDTLTVLACFAWIFACGPTPAAILGYVALSLFSCVFVLKDERVHFEHCSLGEQWLHSALFVFHPLTLLAFGLMWAPSRGMSLGVSWLEGGIDARHALVGQAAATAVIFVYQVVYWNVVRPPSPVAPRGVGHANFVE
jgi:hypothetical protein